MGDFDSLGEPLPVGCEVVRAQVHKNETDTILALIEGMKRGYRTFKIFGALGGRLDHTLANIQTLRWLQCEGAEGHIIDDDCEMWMLTDGQMKLKRREGWFLSVFAYTKQCGGVSLSGVLYPLDRVVLTDSFSAGREQRDNESEASITVERRHAGGDAAA